MRNVMAGFLFLLAGMLGAATTALACFYTPGYVTDCTIVLYEVCSYNQDGTGGLYATGRSRIYVNVNCIA